MEKQHTKDKTFEKFTWTIQNFSKLDSKKLYSETFFLGGHPWRIIIFPKGNNATNYLSIYLDAGDLANLPENWSRVTNFKFTLINQLIAGKTIKKETEHEFNAREPDWGYREFISFGELRGGGFIVNDTCIIEAEICVIKSEPEVDEAVSKTLVSASAVRSEPIEFTDNNPLSKEFSTALIGELVDFRGLGKIEKTFVPLLEEVCSWHPSLIDCQLRRTRRFKEWAFTAMGRVLHFLKTKKVKDMNEDTFSHLQVLWEELETYKFNLSWLEPHIQSALGMKSYVDRVEQVKRMKENVAALERETEKLKEKFVSTVIDLGISRRDLVKAEESLEERDLDAELGYGGQ